MKALSIGIVALVFAIAPLSAEIADSSASGFTVKQTVNIQASPQDVYAKLFKIADWWSSDHTFSRDAHNLSLEEKVGGCFCEKMPGGGGVKHMEVASLATGKSLVLRGALGPLHTQAATGVMQIQLTAADGGTKVEITYAASGYLPTGMNTMATPFDMVMKMQFTRLKSLIEKGDAAK